MPMLIHCPIQVDSSNIASINTYAVAIHDSDDELLWLLIELA